MRFRAGDDDVVRLHPRPGAAGHGRTARRRSAGATVGTPVFAGMLVASTIGIFLIPMLYVVFQRLREWSLRKTATAASRDYFPAKARRWQLRPSGDIPSHVTIVTPAEAEAEIRAIMQERIVAVRAKCGQAGRRTSGGRRLPTTCSDARISRHRCGATAWPAMVRRL